MLATLRARTSPATAPTLLVPFAVCGAAGLLLGGLTLLLQGILSGVFNHLANSGAVWSVGAFVAGALLVYREAPGAPVTTAADAVTTDTATVVTATTGTADAAPADAMTIDAMTADAMTDGAASPAGDAPAGTAPTAGALAANVPAATAAHPGRRLGHARGQWIPVIAGLIVEVGAVVGYYGSTTIFNGDDVSVDALRGPLVWIVVAFLAGPLYGLAGAAYRGARHRERVAAAALLGTVFVAEAGYLLAVLHYGGEAVIMAVIGLAVPVALGRTKRARLHGLLAVLVLIPLGLLAMWLLSLGVDMAFSA